MISKMEKLINEDTQSSVFFIGVDSMNRDIEIIRSILSNPKKYEGQPIDDDKIKYHLKILSDSDFLEGEYIFGDGSFLWTQINLTWEGHELLSSISNKDVWETVKERMKDNDMSIDEVPIEVIKKLAQEVIKDMFGG